MPLLRRSLTHDELQRRLQVALNEGTSNIAQTLVGFNVRTGYTHAGKLPCVLWWHVTRNLHISEPLVVLPWKYQFRYLNVILNISMQIYVIM